MSAALVQDRLEIIEAYGVRHRCLLGAWEISTLAKSVSIDNLEPLLKSKLELLERPLWSRTFDQAPSCFNSFTMIALDKRDIGWQSSFGVLLSHGKQLNMIYCFQQVFDLIVIISVIGINKRTIWQLIGIILQGINIAKASMGQKT